MNEDRDRRMAGAEPSGRIIYIVAPSGAIGGGMGRVKDYILDHAGDASGQYRFEPLVTRDERGAGFSLVLLLLAILRIWRDRLTGRLALVHVNFGDKGSAFRKGIITLAARLVGAKVALHLHAGALPGDYAAAGRFKRFLIRQPFRAASSIIVLGDLWRRWLGEDLGINIAKIDVLFNGVSIDDLPIEAETAGRKALGILFLGQLSEKKGVGDLFDALSRLGPENPPWRLVLAGNGDITHWRARAEALGIAAHVHFTGWIEQKDVRRLLGKADMLVLPSHHEGLPLVILEAMGAGISVICTPVGVIPEALSNDETALFVPVKNPEALSQALARLLGDEDLRARLAENGKAAFAARFTVEAFLGGLYAIYGKRFGLAIKAKHS